MVIFKSVHLLLSYEYKCRSYKEQFNTLIPGTSENLGGSIIVKYFCLLFLPPWHRVAFTVTGVQNS